MYRVLTVQNGVAMYGTLAHDSLKFPRLVLFCTLTAP